MQHLRQRKTGRGREVCQQLRRKHIAGQKVTDRGRRREEFNLNASTELAGGCGAGGGVSKMQMKERKKRELIALLIKKNCVCVCVCLAWFSSSGNSMPSQTTAIKWALVNWRLKDERLGPDFQMGNGYTHTHTHTCTICLTLKGT